jgi:inositol-hexakisphosphate kinase
VPQVYQADKQIDCDKYRGRALDVDGVKQALCQFLHNGTRLIAPLISPMLSRLRQLHEVVTRHNTFRFYSSSLLIMYDGYDWIGYGSSGSQPQASDANDSRHLARVVDDQKKLEPDAPHKFDVRMIDFAHVTFQGFNERDAVHSGPDHGYLFGLEKLIETLNEISPTYQCLN